MRCKALQSAICIIVLKNPQTRKTKRSVCIIIIELRGENLARLPSIPGKTSNFILNLLIATCGIKGRVSWVSVGGFGVETSFHEMIGETLVLEALAFGEPVVGVGEGEACAVDVVTGGDVNLAVAGMVDAVYGGDGVSVLVVSTSKSMGFAHIA